VKTIPRTASLAYRAPLLARLVSLDAPASIVCNEIALVLRAGYLAYGDKMNKHLADCDLSPCDWHPPKTYTKKGDRVLNAVEELEAAKAQHSRERVIHWAAVLVQAASDLATGYLGEEAQNIAMERIDNERP
jgi:hypothetical protein